MGVVCCFPFAVLLLPSPLFRVTMPHAEAVCAHCSLRYTRQLEDAVMSLQVLRNLEPRASQTVHTDI